MRKIKNKTCKIYKNCETVPCGGVMNRCSPSYCSKGSKNWSSCNMANWNPEYKKYCKSESNCRMSRRNIVSKDQVLAS